MVPVKSELSTVVDVCEMVDIGFGDKDAGISQIGIFCWCGCRWLW